MPSMKRAAALTLLTLLTVSLGLFAQSSSPNDAQYFSSLRWRLVGPHRAGRLWTVAGVPSDPTTYYAGSPAGALWKSTNGGLTWASISDALPVTGIGFVAVAPSNSKIVYVGTGSNTLGAGVFRSDDGGATWRSAGLGDTKYITALVIDPRDPNVVIAAAGSGGNFGSMVFYNNNPSAARGLYRTADGGRTWKHALFIDNATSAVELAMDPTTPAIVYASLTNGLYKSIDNGVTWTPLAATGLTVKGTAIVVAPGTNAKRLFAIGGGRNGGGLFRSDDGGATFRVMTSQLASAGGRLYVDPKNPDVVYAMGTAVYRSTDGGKTLEAIKGAPGGDDPHALWIDPTNPRRMIMGADQGPAITVDGGATWTPWYTMPNGEFYFLSTDTQFPYRIYAAQQDSGTVSILSRSDFGAIRPEDWAPVSGYEQGHIFNDPLNTRYVYSHGGGHVITRFDRVTGQAGPVFVPAADDRFGPRPGMDLSPKDPRWMFVGSQFVYASNDRVNWTKISGDLAVRADRATPNAPSGNNGTITALAASPVDVNVLWAGTSNGMVQLTRDMGKTWTNVSPARLSGDASLTIWSMEASSHDAGVAYVGAIDLSDAHRPAFFRTTDFGATWTEINNGLRADAPTRAVREDSKVSSLLYGATQRGVYVSFDRGDHWQPLQLNLPPAAVNDLTVHGDDLIAATWGRAIWALDNVTPLRQIAAARAAAASRTPFLFEPATATRVRWDNNHDTPLPPEVPQGQNPPDGVAIDYVLPRDTSVRVEIVDAAGRIVHAINDAAPPVDARMPNVAPAWFKAPQVAPRTAGMHRVVWDLRYTTPASLDFNSTGDEADTVSFGLIAPAIIGQSPKQQPIGSLVVPGTYTIRLITGDATLTRALSVVNDPRSEASAADITAQFAQEMRLMNGIAASRAGIDALNVMRAAVKSAAASRPALAAAARTFDSAASAVITALAGNRGFGSLLADLEFADMKPAPSVITAIDAQCARGDQSLARFRDFVAKELAAWNAAASAAGAPVLMAGAAVPASACVR